MITIVESGGANIASIQCALARLGVNAELSRDPNTIRQSSHVILPGVGSAGNAMQQLQKNSLVDVIPALTQPVLGICLGMQLLFDFSAENDSECLGIIPGKINKLTSKHEKLIVPHMGWNTLTILERNRLLKNIPIHSYSYFVHSYAASIGKFTCASTFYGENFSAVVQKNNFYGTQFHPEKSSVVGSIILKNFLEL